MTLKISPVTKSNAIALRLDSLHSITGLAWRRIAQIPEFYRIPIRTLSAIATGKRGVPKKYSQQLGSPSVAKVPVCTDPSCKGYGKPHVYDCHTEKVKRQRPPLPTWVTEAANKLAELERKAQPSPNRTYNRKGKRTT